MSELRPVPGLPAAAALVWALKNGLEQGLGEDEHEWTARLLNHYDGYATAERLVRLLVGRASTGHILFVDQLEEYAIAEPAAARDLFGWLAALAGNNGTAGLRVVATARPDSLDALITADTADLVSEAVQFLAPLASRDLLRAVYTSVPLRSELRFDHGLPERIVKDAGDEPGQMALVQFALAELYTRRTSSMLTHDAYNDMGGVAGALVGHADATLAGLTQAQRDCARRLFVQLARLGDGDTFFRRPARAVDLAPELLDLTRELARGRLVVLSHAPSGAGTEEIVELAHDALTRVWPWLRGWLVESRDFRVWQEQLRADLHHWQAQHQESACLLNGSDLAVALDMLDRQPEDISADERDYILLSRRRSRWRAGRAVQAVSAAMERVAVSMSRGRDSEGWRHWQVLTVVGLWIAVLLAASSISVREVLESLRLHGHLGPSDTPAVVTAIVALSAATGTLIGVILTAYAKYVQARGQAEADLIRARAEMMRAEADVTRARAGLPPVAPSTNGDLPAATPPAEPDNSNSQPSPSGGTI
ncbi:hypothetical protein ACIQU1_19895 [Streptomyces angustmyceticus]|uniref:nSTAND1 domain-containing NTPase n=1 Tax=Streptomyces angustmyceticus TaxID=285578 RepID=UPI0038047CF9